MSIAQLHLDPLGGLAGDMFVAALLHAFPALAEDALRTASAVAETTCALRPCNDGVLAGQRFEVAGETGHGDVKGHGHASWRDVQARLQAAALPDNARAHAIAIFRHLAEAEARVHGIAAGEVTFHEVGATNSIADIVAAASIIAALPRACWSIGPLPLGTGTVRTAHGWLPVPAPATALLLEGFVVTDDGLPGERVTPTGAAILRHLRPRTARGARAAPGAQRRRLRHPHPARPQQRAARAGLRGSGGAGGGRAASRAGGHLFRNRRPDGRGHGDRAGQPAARRRCARRAANDGHRQEGRMATHVQVLVRPDALERAVAACFDETPTIGLRTHLVEGRALPRSTGSVAIGDTTLRAKTADRPGGKTLKLEADDLLGVPGHAARARLRRRAELALEEAAA